MFLKPAQPAIRLTVLAWLSVVGLVTDVKAQDSLEITIRAQIGNATLFCRRF